MYHLSTRRKNPKIAVLEGARSPLARSRSRARDVYAPRDRGASDPARVIGVLFVTQVSDGRSFRVTTPPGCSRRMANGLSGSPMRRDCLEGRPRGGRLHRRQSGPPASPVKEPWPSFGLGKVHAAQQVLKARVRAQVIEPRINLQKYHDGISFSVASFQTAESLVVLA